MHRQVWVAKAAYTLALDLNQEKVEQLKADFPEADVRLADKDTIITFLASGRVTDGFPDGTRSRNPRFQLNSLPNPHQSSPAARERRPSFP
jgi:hypothetical protein